MATLNASNYTIGQAEIWFTEEEAKNPTVGTTVATLMISFGNITVAEIAPDVSYAEHYISVKGNRRKDKQVAVSKSISIPFTFDELNTNNIRLFMLGTTINAASYMPVMKKESFEGRAIINFQTDVGNNFIYVIPKVNLRADGALGFSSEDWMAANFVLEVLYHSTYKVDASPSLELAPYGYIGFNESAIGSPF